MIRIILNKCVHNFEQSKAFTVFELTNIRNEGTNPDRD